MAKDISGVLNILDIIRYLLFAILYFNIKSKNNYLSIYF